MSGKVAKNFRRQLKGCYSEMLDSTQTVIFRKKLGSRLKIALCVIFKKPYDLFKI